jgi:hypothetical protein
MLSEEKELSVDVLGARTHFGKKNEFTSAGIVTESLHKILVLGGTTLMPRAVVS